jgi:hypothetical protein
MFLMEIGLSIQLERITFQVVRTNSRIKRQLIVHVVLTQEINLLCNYVYGESEVSSLGLK